MIVFIKKIYKGNYDADVEAKTFFLYGLPLEGVDLDLWTVHPFSHTLTLSSYLDSTELPWSHWLTTSRNSRVRVL